MIDPRTSLSIYCAALQLYLEKSAVPCWHRCLQSHQVHVSYCGRNLTVTKNVWGHSDVCLHIIHSGLSY